MQLTIYCRRNCDSMTRYARHPESALPHHTAGTPQLPAHQPHSAPPGHPVHRLVQQASSSRWSRDLRIALWRLFSDLDLSEAQEDAIQEPARLLHPRAQGRRAAGRRRPGIAGQPLRRHRRRLRHGHRRRAAAGQGLSLHAEGSARRPELVAELSRRQLRHAAPDLEHVPPLPCAARLPGRAGDLHLRRHLERQPDRAQARREAVLQERARGDPQPSSPPAANSVTLVPVAAILVASIRLHFLDVLLHLQLPRART